jgi:hypothetical protein
MNPATAWLSSSFAQKILRQKKHLHGKTEQSDRERVRDATERNQKGKQNQKKQSDESQGNAQNLARKQAFCRKHTKVRTVQRNTRNT